MADDDLGFDDNTENTSGSDKKGKGVGGLFPMLLKWIAIILGAIIIIVTVSVITVKIVSGNTAHQQYIKTVDPVPASVIVDVVIGYKVGDKAASTEITQRQIEIVSFLRRYFSQLTVEDLKPQNEDKRCIEIRNAINDDILSSSKIRDVQFKSLQVIEQY